MSEIYLPENLRFSDEKTGVKDSHWIPLEQARNYVELVEGWYPYPPGIWLPDCLRYSDVGKGMKDSQWIPLEEAKKHLDYLRRELHWRKEQ
jgi:hypothetical protein